MHSHIIPVPWSTHREALQQIREAVFVIEQRVPRELEWDGEDDQASHFIALDEAGQPVGCARLLPTGQIGRMAVLASHRGTGLGMKLLREAVEEAGRQGFRQVFLHAQTQAEAFYRKAGFLPSGGEFMEAGIPHLSMEMDLPIPFEPPQVDNVRPGPVANDFERPATAPAQAQTFRGEHDCRVGLAACLRHPRRRLDILSHYLDHALFDVEDVANAVSAFARSSRYTEVRVLITDSSLIVGRGHRLLELARRLDSRIAIRRIPEALAPGETSFVTWDDRGFLLLPDFRDYTALANADDPVQAKRLTERFDRLWERSSSDPDLRVLQI